MSFDPKDFFDPVEGEPLRDILGHLQNANIRQGQQETNQKLHKVASLLEEQQAEARRLAVLPSCPFCGGKIDGQYELCMHCRSSLSWVDGLPCKPGQEDDFRFALEKRRARIAYDNYMNQKVEFSKLDNISDHIIYRCICGNRLTSKCSDIGSEKTCPNCREVLVVIGEYEYKKYLDDIETEKEKSMTIIIVLGAIAIFIAFMIRVSYIP